MKLQDLRTKTDIVYAYSGLLLSIIILIVTSIIQPSYLGMGIILFVACGVYLLVKKQLFTLEKIDLFEIKLNYFTEKQFYYILNILFIILLTASILSLHLSLYMRPLIYFILTILACVLVSIEIFIHKRNWLILTKILLISISLRASLYYLFPGLVASDPYFWVTQINYVLKEGSLLANNLYYHYPIFNLIVTTTLLISSLNIKNSMFMSIGFFEILGTVYIYLIGKTVSNSRMGLIAALLLGISQFHIRMGALIFQMSIGLGLYTLVIYFFFKKIKTNDIRFKLLLILSVLLMVVTHHLSTLILQIALLSMLIGQIYFIVLHKDTNNNNKLFKFNNLSIPIYMISIVSMLAYWMYNGSWQFNHLVNSLSNILQDKVSNEIITSSIEYGIFAKQFKQAGILYFILLSIFGNLYWTSSEVKNKQKIILTFGGCLLTLSIFIIIFSGFSNAIISRWFPFAYVLLAIPASQGILIIMNCFKSNYNKVLSLILVVILFSSIMMTTYNEDLEPSIITENQILWRYYYSDIVSANNMLEMINSTEILSDDRYIVYLRSQPTTHDINFFNVESKGVVIIREYYLNKYHLFTIKKEFTTERNELEKYNGTEMVQYYDSIQNRFYDSSYIKGFY